MGSGGRAQESTEARGDRRSYGSRPPRGVRLDGRSSGTSARSSSPTGASPADYDQAAFQGIHARYVLVIIDEAGGVPKSIFDAVDALAASVHARVVAVGNPDDPGSHFATICKPGSGWAVKKISAFDTPAYTGEQVPEELLPLLVSPEWVHERKKRWGVTSPIYTSKVLRRVPGHLRRHADHAEVDRGRAGPLDQAQRSTRCWRGTSRASARTRPWASSPARSERSRHTPSRSPLPKSAGIASSKPLICWLPCGFGRRTTTARSRPSGRSLTLDTVALRDVASQLRGLEGREAKTASASATASAMAKLPAKAACGRLASYALRAL